MHQGKGEPEGVRAATCARVGEAGDVRGGGCEKKRGTRTVRIGGRYHETWNYRAFLRSVLRLGPPLDLETVHRSRSLPTVPSVVMRRILILACLFACFGLSSCQCSDKPDIGPVEDDDGQAHVAIERAVHRA